MGMEMAGKVKVEGEVIQSYKGFGLDHGILNVPLSKRGNIDREIDQHKAVTAATAKAHAKVARAELLRLRPIAKAAVEAMPQDMLVRIGDKAGLTAAQVRRNLMSDAHWAPTPLLAKLGVQA